MLPFGYLTELHRNRSSPFLKKWTKNLRAFIVGNGDLHGLVRCPPLSKRLDRGAQLVCDVGCGGGDFHLESILRLGFKGKIVAVDVNFKALNAAKEAARLCGLYAQTFYICASADHLPFADEVFDQVFLVDVIEHVHADDRVLQQCCRILRAGGMLEISTPTPLYPQVFGFRMHMHVGHVRMGYLLSDLVERLQATDFEVTHQKQNTGYLLWPWMSLWYRTALTGPKGFVGKLLYNLILAVFSLIVRFSGLFDVFGGYCSNDVEARKSL